MSTRKKSGLGTNPLAAVTPPVAKGVFEKTAEVEVVKPAAGASQNPESRIQNPETAKQKVENRIQKAESGKKNPVNRKKKADPGFLQEDQEMDKVSLRLPIELNDWLNDLLRQGKRNHGQKIPKEIWLQAALEFLRAMPIDWSQIESIDQLRETLQTLEKSIQNLDG